MKHPFGFGASARMAAACAAGTAAVSVSGMAANKAARPNVIYFLVDDLGWSDLGCYGSKFYETPNIDALAASGTRFVNGYASHPVCSPTRAAIMTGKNPCRAEINITDWIKGERRQYEKLLPPKINYNLPLKETTLPEYLKKYGYQTWHIGKWHLGETERSWPKAHGFDVNIGGYSIGHPNSYYSPYRNPKLKDGPKGEYLTDRLTDEALKLLENRDKAKPFFMYFAFYAVHAKIVACKRYIDRFVKKRKKMFGSSPTPFAKESERGITRQRQDNPKYASMLYDLDVNIGRVVDFLKKNGLWDNTIIIFSGDNGGLSTLQRKGAPDCLLPLRAGKGWCYEGGQRTPFIIRDPLIKKQPKTCDTPVCATDVYATVLDCCGLPLFPKQHKDSASLKPLLESSGGALKRPSPMVWFYPHYHGSGWTPGASILKDGWKLVVFYHYDRVELYNVKNDIGEKHNLADKYPEKVAALKKELEAYLKSVGAVMPKKNPHPGKRPKKKPKKK